MKDVRFDGLLASMISPLSGVKKIWSLKDSPAIAFYYESSRGIITRCYLCLVPPVTIGDKQPQEHSRGESWSLHAWTDGLMKEYPGNIVVSFNTWFPHSIHEVMPSLTNIKSAWHLWKQVPALQLTTFANQ